MCIEINSWLKWEHPLCIQLFQSAVLRVLDSNLNWEASCPDYDLSWFSSVPQGKCCESTSDSGHHHIPANPLTIHHTLAVPQLGRLTTSFSWQRIRFNSWPGHVKFMLDKAAQAQAFLRVPGLLPSILFHQYAITIHSFIHSFIHYQRCISATYSVIKI
jgi:hypothetical protein